MAIVRGLPVGFQLQMPLYHQDLAKLVSQLAGAGLSVQCPCVRPGFGYVVRGSLLWLLLEYIRLLRVSRLCVRVCYQTAKTTVAHWRITRWV